MDATRKVLIVHVPYEYRGGEDVHVEVLARAYAQLGLEARFYPPDRTPPAQLARQAPPSLWPGAGPGPGLEQLVSEQKPALLHLHNIYPILGPRFLRWTLQRGLPVVMTVHNHRFFCTNGFALRDHRPCRDCFRSRITFRPVLHNCNGDLKKSVYYSLALNQVRRADLLRRAVHRFVAPSPYIRDQLEQWGVEGSKIVTILNPVEGTAPGEESAPGPRAPDVFYAGRLSTEKGIQVLLETCALLPELRFAIAGAGPEEPRVKERAGALQNLQFFGRLPHEEVQRLLRASRIGILPSICNEILPTFTLEAFCQGKVCVIPDLDSTRWLAEDPFPGVLADTASAPALAAAVRKALTLPGSSLDQLAVIREKFSFTRFCHELKTKVLEAGW